MLTVSPTGMLQQANQFDSTVKQMLAQYFDINLDCAMVLDDIVPGSQLDSEQIIQLAKFRISNSNWVRPQWHLLLSLLLWQLPIAICSAQCLFSPKNKQF
jgi:hypothetical protein